MTRLATLSNISAKNALASPARNQGRPFPRPACVVTAAPSVVQPRRRQERLARGRRTEAVHGDRGEDDKQEERSPRVPGGGIRRQRELQKVREVVLDEQNEQAETEEEDDVPGCDEDSGSREEGPARQEVDERPEEHERGGREPVLLQRGAKERKEERIGHSAEQRDTDCPEQVRGDEARPQERHGEDEEPGGRRRLERLVGDARGLPQDRFESAEQSSREHDASHERIGEASGKKARPRDERIGPAPPEDRLERDVQDPGKRGAEERQAHSGQEDGELRDARNMVRVKRPADEGAGEEERGESHRAAPVAPPEAQVSP